MVRAHRLKYVGKRHPDFEEAFDGERILQHRGTEGNRHYLVRWKGYGPQDDQWIPESDFHTYEIIQDYWNAIQPSIIHTPPSESSSLTSSDIS